MVLLAVAAAATASLTVTGCSPATESAEGITVPALWAAADRSTGGVEPATISIAQDAVPGWSVNLATESAHGAGSQWLAASGEAAATATLYSGINPAELSIAFDVTGPIDGPSAGAILTVGALAALRGDALNPKVTMTGTISPVGTIGPVGGVSEKAAAASKAGFTTMLVPAGQAPDKAVPGLSIIEAGTFVDAYRVFTGVDLNRHLPAPEISPEVTSAGEYQARLLANTTDMAEARTAVHERAAAAAAAWTPTQIEAKASAVQAAMDTLLEGTVSQVAQATAAGKVTSGRLGAISPLLAAALRASVAAQGASAWARNHPADVEGVREAAAITARSWATVTELTPALIAVAAATPGAAADPAKAESALRGYTAFERAAGHAATTYIAEVFGARSADVADDLVLSVVAETVRGLTDPSTESTPGLAGALLDQTRALAGWQAAATASSVIESFEGSPTTTAPDLRSVTAMLAAMTDATFRDPSMALWIDTWVLRDRDRIGLLIGSAAIASILAATPQSVD